ncbi:MAG TPA: hypothetical protein DCE42_13075 [Myxococcales bacterium]|nr:hypothetical protein [Myxococcales bacterium]
MSHTQKEDSMKVLGWLVRFFGMMFLMSCCMYACEPAETCTDVISDGVLEPDGSPCTKDCECNNQGYEGYCINEVCVSLKREVCDSPGRKETCDIQDKFATKVGTCGKSGERTCKDTGLTSNVWGNCTCPSSTTEGGSESMQESTQETIPEKPPELQRCTKRYVVGNHCASDVDCCSGQTCLTLVDIPPRKVCSCKSESDCPEGFKCCVKNEKLFCARICP